MSPVWGRVPPSAQSPPRGAGRSVCPNPAVTPPVTSLRGHGHAGTSRGRNTLLPSVQNAAAAGFPLETGGGVTSRCPSQLRDSSGPQPVEVLETNRWKPGVLRALLSQAQPSGCETLLHYFKISLQCGFAFATLFPNHVAIQTSLSKKDCSFPR